MSIEPYASTLAESLGIMMHSPPVGTVIATTVPLTPGAILAMLRIRLADMDQQIQQLTNALQTNSETAEDLGRQIHERRELMEAVRGHLDSSGNVNWSDFPEAQRAQLQERFAAIGLTGEARHASLGGLSERVSEIRERQTSGIASPEESAELAELESLYNTMARMRGGPIRMDGTVDWSRVPEDQRVALQERFARAGMDGVAHPVNRDALQDQIDRLGEDLKRVNSGNEMLMVQLQSTMQQRTSVVQMSTNMLKSIDEGMDAIVGNLR
jgi:hypothetical protein